MDSACISTLAVLGGALIRGLTSFAASDEGSKLHADSLIHDAPDVSQRIRLYAMISMMRALSPTPVIENADKVAQRIVYTYLVANKNSPNYATRE